MQGNQIKPLRSQDLTESCSLMLSNHLTPIYPLKLKAYVWVEQQKMQCTRNNYLQLVAFVKNKSEFPTVHKHVISFQSPSSYPIF